MKLGNRLMRRHLKYKEETMQRLLDIINADSGEKIIRFEAVSCINHLLEEGFDEDTEVCLSHKPDFFQ